MAAVYTINKWVARFLLVMLIYSSVNAQIGQLGDDWMAKEIDKNNKQWCGKSDYCDSLYELDDASSTTEFSIEEKHGRTTMKPNDMEDDRLVYFVCFFQNFTIESNLNEWLFTLKKI